MRGTPVMASGIEYHERHSLTAEGHVSARFGKFLEIPEDLEPIPASVRPTALFASHPLAKFVKVYEIHSAHESGRLEIQNVVFADQDVGVVVTLAPDVPPDALGALPAHAWVRGTVDVVYDEEAIAKENDRRLKKAMEIAAMYAAVIEAHQERVEFERITRESNEAIAKSLENGAGFTTDTTTPTTQPTNGDDQN